MRHFCLKTLLILPLLLLLAAPMVWAGVSSVEVLNISPKIQFDDQKGFLKPQVLKNTIQFNVFARDLNNDSYYLALCSSSEITPGILAEPACNDYTFSVSEKTPSNKMASLELDSNELDRLSAGWYLFACDHSLSSKCSSALYGKGLNEAIQVADIPLAPVLVLVKDDEVSIRLNESSSLNEMAVYVDGNSNCDGLGGLGYVKLDGSLATEEEWHSPSVWGEFLVKGLISGKRYSVCAKSRNSRLDETPFGSTTFFQMNSFPRFKGRGPQDHSSLLEPTEDGAFIEFSAQVEDKDGDELRLLVCKNEGSPQWEPHLSCSGGLKNQWALGEFSKKEFISAQYEPRNNDPTLNEWYAFVCDSFSCSPPSSGDLLGGSPFALSHFSELDRFTFNDEALIFPGDLVTAQLKKGSLSRSAKSSANSLIDLYICDLNSTDFDLNLRKCVNGELLCSIEGFDIENEDYTCDLPRSINSFSSQSGKRLLNVYGFDSIGMPLKLVSNSFFEIQNTPPRLIEYIGLDQPQPAAGSFDLVDFSVLIEDLNGVQDIVNVEGYLFDSDEVLINQGKCLEDDNNCYFDSSCELKSTDNPNEVFANCQVAVWFNANPGSNWEFRVNVTDADGQFYNEFSNSDVNLVNPVISALGISSFSPSYGPLLPGQISEQREVLIQNFGNIETDISIEGTHLISNNDYIDRSNQKWSLEDDFRFRNGFSLVEVSDQKSESTGCLDANLAVRNHHTGVDEVDMKLFWKLKVPERLRSGDYRGLNYFSPTICR